MENRFRKAISIAVLSWGIFDASALLLFADDDDDDDQFSEWSAPVNLGPVVNTASFDVGASISKDGLSLYFGSARPGGFGGLDIYVSQRTRLDAPWGPPRNLGAVINTRFNDQAPSVSVDRHRLYFQSDRPGGFGGSDLYVSRRHNKRDDFAWRPPENLGGGVNTFANEAQPSAPFEDDNTGTTTLYFTSDQPGGMGGDDIYASTLQPDETFGPALLVEELSTPFQDRQPGIRRDGLEMFLTSDRPGTLGSTDLWAARRAATSDPWSAAVNLGPVVNSTGNDGRAALAFNGTELYFQSNRPGGFGGQDLYVTTRTKLHEPDEQE